MQRKRISKTTKIDDEVKCKQSIKARRHRF
jgi:hypothetical protein